MKRLAFAAAVLVLAACSAKEEPAADTAAMTTPPAMAPAPADTGMVMDTGMKMDSMADTSMKKTP
jgi:uncharacterized lipoprotein YajG